MLCDATRRELRSLALQPNFDYRDHQDRSIAAQLRLAYAVASAFSDDPSTHNGAVLVTEDGDMMWGVNHIPRGVKITEERLDRDRKKYRYMEHAERDVIHKAAEAGLKTRGATLYVPWYACHDCARAIIGAGIGQIIGHKQMFDKTPERWKASIEDGMAMLEEAGILRMQFDGPIGRVRVLFDGEYWEP